MQKLWIRSVTFTQSNHAGTETHLELLRDPQQGALQLSPSQDGDKKN
jgi:hypothetical protein